MMKVTRMIVITSSFFFILEVFAECKIELKQLGLQIVHDMVAMYGVTFHSMHAF